MMSAWVIGLGIAAGYLINKNVHMQKRLTESVQEFQESAKPAEPGPQSKEIRAVQRSVPASERYESLNLQDLDRTDVDALVKMKDAAAQEVLQYEAPTLPEIQGVYLQRGI